MSGVINSNVQIEQLRRIVDSLKHLREQHIYLLDKSSTRQRFDSAITSLTDIIENYDLLSKPNHNHTELLNSFKSLHIDPRIAVTENDRLEIEKVNDELSIAQDKLYNADKTLNKIQSAETMALLEGITLSKDFKIVLAAAQSNYERCVVAYEAANERCDAVKMAIYNRKINELNNLVAVPTAAAPSPNSNYSFENIMKESAKIRKMILSIIGFADIPVSDNFLADPKSAQAFINFQKTDPVTANAFIELMKADPVTVNVFVDTNEINPTTIKAFVNAHKTDS